MSNPQSGWQIGLSEFKAADRDYIPVSSVELTRVVLPLIGCKLEWEEDAENGIYGATLSDDLYVQLVTTGHIEVEFRSRDGVFKLTAETDIDHIDQAVGFGL